MTSETQARPNPPSLIIIALIFAIIVLFGLAIAMVVAGAGATVQSDAFKRIEQKLDAPAQTGPAR